MRRFYDTKFDKEIVYLAPGDHYVTDEDIILQTLLGSCISVCLYSETSNVIGMNHFMLPSITDPKNFTHDASGRYGMYAMELLFNDFYKKGVKDHALKAKVFGGSNMLDMDKRSDGIASNNIKFIINFLHDEKIPMISSHLGGSKARRILFFGRTKKVLLKEVEKIENAQAVQEEKTYQRKIQPESHKSNIILFND